MNKQIDPTKLDVITASFFWKNNEPGGLGFSFGPPGFTPSQVQDMFFGPVPKTYIRESDLQLGSGIVNDMLAQLEALGQRKLQGKEIPFEWAVLAAYNIMWLAERGFIPQDEFNGTQFIGGAK